MTKEALLYSTLSLHRLWPRLLVQHVMHNSYRVLFKRGPCSQHLIKLTCHPQANTEAWILRIFSNFSSFAMLYVSSFQNWKLIESESEWKEGVADPWELSPNSHSLPFYCSLVQEGRQKTVDGVELIINTRHTVFRASKRGREEEHAEESKWLRVKRKTCK